VYVNGVYQATVSSRNAKTSVTHISFAQWNDGAGAFYVDNVYAEEVIPVTWTITATAGTGGIIDPSGDVVVADGADQAFTITPDAGYHILDVLVDLSSVGAVDFYEFTGVVADHTIDASFELDEYTLTVNTVGSGSVAKDPDQASYHYGDVVQLTATADPGWKFTGWSGDLSGSVNPEFITMDEGKTVTATFAETTWTITATAGTGGIIDPSGDVVVADGADQAFTITPDAGYHILDVLVDAVSEGAIGEYTFTAVDADHAIEAQFEADVLVGLLVDGALEYSHSSEYLRADGATQDWYESRGQAPTLLTLDETDVAGYSTRKAGFTASSTTNAYMSQEFSSAQTGVFSAQWDIYVDSILDISGNPDRAGWMLIGDNSVGTTPGPNSDNNERFVYMAFFKDGGGTSGTMDLVARDSNDGWTAFTTVASGLNLKQWYTIKVVCDLDVDTYDVYVNGVYQATVSSRNAKTSVTHISFAQWNDGAGAFYVDNVYAAPSPPPPP
jgi:hypothetical protein